MNLFDLQMHAWITCSTRHGSRLDASITCPLRADDRCVHNTCFCFHTNKPGASGCRADWCGSFPAQGADVGPHHLNAGMQAVDATDRNAWARFMRARFSPPAMLNDDASINQNYFRPGQAWSDIPCAPPSPCLDGPASCTLRFTKLTQLQGGYLGSSVNARASPTGPAHRQPAVGRQAGRATARGILPPSAMHSL